VSVENQIWCTVVQTKPVSMHQPNQDVGGPAEPVF